MFPMTKDSLWTRRLLVPILDVCVDTLSGRVVRCVIAETTLEDDLLQVVDGQVGLDVQHREDLVARLTAGSGPGLCALLFGAEALIQHGFLRPLAIVAANWLPITCCMLFTNVIDHVVLSRIAFVTAVLATINFSIKVLLPYVV